MYLHCHTIGCNWSQDDFWSFKLGGYNPLYYFLSRLFTKQHSLLIPRIIEFDISVIKDYKWKTNKVHSWWLIWWEFKSMILQFKKQEWWTYKQFEKDYGRGAVCPKCGMRNFDVD